MTLDELLQANIDMLRRMKAEDWNEKQMIKDYKVSIYAHRWWNFDEQPPAEYYYNVREYVKCHPEEFKGAGPQ